MSSKCIIFSRNENPIIIFVHMKHSITHDIMLLDFLEKEGKIKK